MFKTPRLEREFQDAIDPRLRAVLLDVIYQGRRRFGYQVVITSLYRTPDENKRVGGSPTSSHLEGRGGDIRNRDMSSTCRDFVGKYLKSVWGDLVHVKDEDDHIHININKHFETPCGNESKTG